MTDDEGADALLAGICDDLAAAWGVDPQTVRVSVGQTYAGRWSAWVRLGRAVCPADVAAVECATPTEALRRLASDAARMRAGEAVR